MRLRDPKLRDAAKNRPQVRIIGVEVDTENVVINSAGETRADNRVIIHPDDVGAMREGYYCAKCLEPQGEAMPKQCWLCGFPMKEKQAEFLAKGYQGNIRVGPQSTADTEMAAMEEFAYRQNAAQRDEILRPSQILLPGKHF